MTNNKENIQIKPELKQGYKQTKLGWIPEEWEVKKLIDVASIKRGRFSPRPRNNPKYYGGNIPFVQTGDVTNAKGIVRTYTQTLNDEGLGVSILFPKGTILITIAANIGHCAILNIDMACPDSLIGINCNTNTHNYYLNYYLNAQQKKIDKLAPSGTQKNINVEFLKPYKIIIPPLPEQKAIAKCLGIWDKAIEKQSQKIEKLKLRKKGLMQQLLTGKKRLTGFDGEWEEVRLGEVVKITKGVQLNKSDLQKEGLYPSYSGGVSPSGYTNKFNTYKNTIIISEGGNSCGYVNFIRTNFWSGGHCYALLNPINHIDNNFLFQILKILEPQIMSLRVGSGLPNVQKKDIEKFKITIAPIKEQTAIANILQTADKEIKLEKLKLDKLKEEKKGLMQQLLTGKKRLKY